MSGGREATPHSEFAYLINFKELGDKSGCLVAIEEERQVPLAIKRVFYIYNLGEGQERGNHANRNSRIVFICIKGSCQIQVDNGEESRRFVLDKPSVGVFTDRMTWKKMDNFSKDCILLALSDCNYDKNEYINDYNEFVISVKQSH